MRKLAITAGNFRAEIARYRLPQKDIAKLIGMNSFMLTSIINENRKGSEASLHNIAWGINRLSGRILFDIDDTNGLRKIRLGRPARANRIGIFPLLPTSSERRKVGRRVG